MPFFEDDPDVSEAVDEARTPLHVDWNQWGVVLDEMAELRDPEDYQRLQRWLEGLDGAGVSEGQFDGDTLRLKSERNGEIDLETADRRTQLGGNAFNTSQALLRTLRSLDPKQISELYFHGVAAPELDAVVQDRNFEHEARGWPLPQHLLETIENARIRVSYVLRDALENSRDPLYAPRHPRPVEMAPLPNAEHVFVSSGGPNIFDRIRDYFDRVPEGKLIMAPGSVQVRTGIPEDILERLHFLNCNREEAVRMGSKLPFPPADSSDPRSLIDAFRAAGVEEIRISDGPHGVHAWTGGRYVYSAGIPREHAGIRDLVTRHGIATMATLIRPDFNGCGDTRLGCELAAERVGIRTPERRLLFANILASVQTFNPNPNIANFPPELIREVMAIVVQYPAENSAVDRYSTTPQTHFAALRA